VAASIAGTGAVLLAVGGVVRLLRRSETKSLPSGGLKFWSGRFGRWLFRLAGWGLKAPAGAAVGRPTELAIGGAAEALYAALPKAARRALGDLPADVRRLEAEAQAARGRIAELDRAIAQADGAGPASGERQRLLADLRTDREAAQRRQAAIVTALETVRLQLLRLSADAGALAGVTQDLERVLSVGRQAEHLLARRDGVEARVT
jgi:hypothetical protein